MREAWAAVCRILSQARPVWLWQSFAVPRQRTAGCVDHGFLCMEQSSAGVCRTVCLRGQRKGAVPGRKRRAGALAGKGGRAPSALRGRAFLSVAVNL